MITVDKYVAELPVGFEFEGTLYGEKIRMILTKEGGQLMIDADAASRKFFDTDTFGEALSQDEAMTNAVLDDELGHYHEISNVTMLLILQEVGKIKDDELRLSLIEKLGV